MQKKVLVIAAHPDDEILGCGATMAKEVAEGAWVKTLIMTTGVTSRYEQAGDVQATHQAEISRLREQAVLANQLLGISEADLTLADFPDQRLDQIPILDLIAYLKNVIQSFQPDVVYGHHYGDYNVDHQVLFKAVQVATRPYAGEHWPKAVYAFEVLSSTEWAWEPGHVFRPTHYVAVADFMAQKKQAMQAYANELRFPPHPRSVEGIEVLGRKRGFEISAPYAEAFELIRSIRD